MRAIRQVFAWFFALIAVCIVLFAGLHGRDLMTHGKFAIVSVMFLALIAYVFAMAWWSTWKEKRGARMWGIAASLVGIAAPLRIPFRHQALTKAEWEMLVWNLFALIAFAWPDRNHVPEPSEQAED